MLANRLSANPSIRVLLLERGKRNDSLLASNVLLTHPPFSFVPNKEIKMVPQKELLNREQVVYESLTLGGRTRINAGLYLPGCSAEYSTWGEGWQWEDVEPFFARSEGRLELETGPCARPRSSEGGEWKTRIIRPEYESSRR